MFEKNNSIKEILKEAKEKLSKDNALTSEKEEFNQKISKALDGNVLVLNKIYGSDSKDNIDQRSKKITEIVEHQSALLLNQEVTSGTESALLLSNEAHENETLILTKEVADEGTLLLDNEYEGPYSDKLKEAGINVTTKIIKGTVHAAENIFPNDIPEIHNQAIEDIKTFSYSLN